MGWRRLAKSVWYADVSSKLPQLSAGAFGLEGNGVCVCDLVSKTPNAWVVERWGVPRLGRLDLLRVLVRLCGFACLLQRAR